jgi:hypothetical protein
MEEFLQTDFIYLNSRYNDRLSRIVNVSENICLLPCTLTRRRKVGMKTTNYEHWSSSQLKITPIISVCSSLALHCYSWSPRLIIARVLPRSSVSSPVSEQNGGQSRPCPLISAADDLNNGHSVTTRPSTMKLILHRLTGRS